jgi:hypothetical protein
LERAERVEGTLLLILDEAHLLSSEVLTDLRQLINSALDVRPPLKILLVRRKPPRVKLRQAQHADLVNRISLRYQLRPLSREQTGHYIDLQLSQAGGDAKLFDDSVITTSSAVCLGRLTTWQRLAYCKRRFARSFASTTSCSGKRLASSNCLKTHSSKLEGDHAAFLWRRLLAPLTQRYRVAESGMAA